MRDAQFYHKTINNTPLENFRSSFRRAFCSSIILHRNAKSHAVSLSLFSLSGRNEKCRINFFLVVVLFHSRHSAVYM